MSPPAASNASKLPLTRAATGTYNGKIIAREGPVDPRESRHPQEEETFMALRHGGPANAWHGHFEPKRVPEGVWMRCDGCQATLFRKQVEQNLNVCPECNHHFSVSAV